MARANVPKFGNWENEDNVPYTVYFDKARKNKGGKMINPNNPQENPDMFPNADPSPFAPPATKSISRTEGSTDRRAVRPVPEHRANREDSDFRQYTSPSQKSVNSGQRTATESSYGGRGQRPAHSTKPSVGSEQSFDRSPLHPQYQAKVMGTGSASPAGWERNGNPVRNRPRPATRGDESPGKGAAVPRFGAWDENGPQSAENFTHIFNKVREERNTTPGNISGTPKHQSYGVRGQHYNEPKQCCFPWW